MTRSKHVFHGLLFLIFLSSLVSKAPSLAPWQTLPALEALMSLLPLAAVLWAVGRGSFPGLVLLAISALTQLDSLFLMIGASTVSGLAGLAGLASGVALLGRLAAVAAFYTDNPTSLYLDWRRSEREQRDLAVEVAVFLAALFLSVLPQLIYYAVYWRELYGALTLS